MENLTQIRVPFRIIFFGVGAVIAILGEFVSIGALACSKSIAGGIHIVPLEQQGFATTVLPDFLVSTNVRAFVAIALESFVACAASYVAVGVLRTTLFKEIGLAIVIN